MKKPWTAQQDYVVIGVTANYGKYGEWPANYCERVATAISKGMDEEHRREPRAVSAKADNVMFILTEGIWGLPNASHRVRVWTQRYLDRDLKATVIVHQALRDADLEDVIPEEIGFV